MISDRDLKLLLDRTDLMAKFEGKKKAAEAKAKNEVKSAVPGVFKVLEDTVEDKGSELRIVSWWRLLGIGID